MPGGKWNPPAEGVAGRLLGPFEEEVLVAELVVGAWF